MKECRRYGKRIMTQAPEKKFPLSAKDYKLYEEVGEGVSATVYRALCVPLNEIVAIKVLDLEKCNSDLDGIRREVQTMILIDHPNLLRAHCSFATGHNLWVVMPFMAGGSCLHIMKSAYPEGFEEHVIATLLRDVLKALVYLHAHGHIHRDVKAGNILLDADGTVKLADFGVAACMYDTGDRQRSRNTFVGTPCWMAPEVMQQLHGYDFKADIWSFGITALELAHGHAPFSKYPPMKVLLMTLQNAPPGLDYERDKRFSKSFREMVATCLVKDPKKRPSSEKLLKHPFFKHGRSNEYLAQSILEGLSPLGERFRVVKVKEADILAQNKAMHEDKEHLSQQEYIRGISAWNFNLEDLKNQAALIQDDFTSNSEDSSVSGKHVDGLENGSPAKKEGFTRATHSEAAYPLDDGLNDVPNLENTLAAFPEKPLQALKGFFDVSDDDICTDNAPFPKDTSRIDSERQSQPLPFSAADKVVGTNGGRDSGQSGSLSHSVSTHRKCSSGLIVQDNVHSPKKFNNDGDREIQPRNSERNPSGPLQYRLKKDFSSYTGDDAPEGAVIERRGRFKVTLAEPNPKGPLNSPNSVHSSFTCSTVPCISAASVLPALQSILQHNISQREDILKLMKMVEPTSGIEHTSASGNDPLQTIPTSIRERELQAQVTQLRQSVASLVEELQKMSARNVELERKLEAAKQNNKIHEQ
ncbi:serine/threonine-protein kinase BLUS1 [Andrographis paniculata]|uniref:serine/threonine-protein kinase BLUS1 n=1 Tax=Andrographis paniculata TaxID=175694 RepID=UPI0021E7BCFA|nr:serine/threonine-protein kinase BLUS1 [Andrographis paniculata]